MKSRILLNKKRTRRQNRVRAVIRGTAKRPRLSVFRSHRYIYAQLIDDVAQKTLASVSSREIKEKANKVNLAKKIGEMLAAKAKKISVQSVVLDRGRYRYHGRVKALAEGVRSGGLNL